MTSLPVTFSRCRENLRSHVSHPLHRAGDHAHYPAEELQRGRAGLALVSESVPLGPAHPVHLVLPLHPAEGIAGPPLRIAILKQDHEM